MLNRPNRATGGKGQVPLYLQVAAVLRHRIEGGQWTANQKISTLDDLEREFGVSRITVRQAVDELHRSGLVRRVQGKGTFVSGTRPETRWLRLNSKWPTLIESIRANAPRFLSVEENRPAPEIRFSNVRPAAAYTSLKSVQSRNGVPFVLAHMHIEQALFETARGQFLSRVALPVIDALPDVRIGEARQTFLIGAADMEASSHLGIALGTPTAEAKLCIADEGGTAIALGEVIYRGDCVHIDVDLFGQGISEA